jgi:disulfide bond formation protein DsbB
MTQFTTLFNDTLGIGFILLIIALIIFILSLAIPHRTLLYFRSHIHNKSLLTAFLLSFSGVVGSLIYSEIIGLTPCELCFWQRIFLYPVAVITALALIHKKESWTLWLEILTLSTIGSLFSLYHILIQSGSATSQCSAASVSNNCATIQTQIWNLITIPEMSLLLSLVLITLSVIKLKRDTN